MRLIIFALISTAIFVGCAQANKSTTDTAAAPAAKAAVTEAGKKDEAKKTEAKPAGDATVCQRDNESRMLKIEPVDPKGCKLLYPNETSSVASSSIAKTHCEQVRGRIQEKLEAAGFKCSPNNVAQK